MTSPLSDPTTVEQQLDLVATALVDNTYTRENPEFALVWVTRQNTPIAVEAMSKDHMLMTIAMWVKKEFVHHERLQFDLLYHGDFKAPEEDSIDGHFSSYMDPALFLECSSAMTNTPPLRTMYARLKGMNALNELYDLIATRAQEARTEIWSRPEYQLSQLPSLFF